MKKLSIFLAILILLISILVITSVLLLKVEAASLSKPAEWNWEANPVSENDAIGYIENGNEDIWVDTLTHAADVARANGGTEVVLYLRRNYTTENRIGYRGTDTNTSYDYDIIDLTNGADLVIDGKNQYSMMSSAVRFIHFNEGTDTTGKGKITFRNITIGTTSTAQGSMQTNQTSLEKITFKNVKISIPVPRSGSSIVLATDAEFDGVTRDCKNEGFVYIHANGTSVTIKNSTISNATYAIDGANHTSKNIEINNFEIESATNVITRVTAEKINIDNVKVQSCTNLFNSVTADITIFDTNVTSTSSIISSFSGNMVINSGNFTTTNDHVIKFDAKDSSTLTINGGTFTSQKVDSAVIYQTENGSVSQSHPVHTNKITTINGGTFNSWTKEEDPDESNVKTTGISLFGILYSSGDTLQVNGGIFNLYNSTGTAITNKGMHTVSRGAGYISINGGTFNGGSLVYFRQDGSEEFTKCEKIALSTPGGTYTIANSLTTLKGASIRTNATTPGIRFQGTVSDDVIDYVKKLSGATNVYSGILIVPASHMDAAGGIPTVEWLSEHSLTWATTNATNLIDNKDGTYTIRLALTGVKEANLSMQYIAITYVYGDVNSNGRLDTSDIVVYAEAPSEPRSIVETAKAALADVMTTSGTYGGRKYTNAVTDHYYKKNGNGEFVKVTAGTMPYTPFTEAQTTVLKAYAAGTLPS